MCGSFKICCNFQWVLVVVRDVEKESEIESEGLQKKGIFFSKNAFLQLQKWQKMRVSRVLRVLRALRALRALSLRLFSVVLQSCSVEFVLRYVSLF